MVCVVAASPGPIVAEKVFMLMKLERAFARFVALIFLRVNTILDDAVAKGATMLPIQGILWVVTVAA